MNRCIWSNLEKRTKIYFLTERAEQMSTYIPNSKVYHMAQSYDAWLEFATGHVNARQSRMPDDKKKDYAQQLAAQWHYKDALDEQAARDKRLDMYLVAKANANFEIAMAALKAVALKAVALKAASEKVAEMRAKLSEAYRVCNESDVYRLAREAGYKGETEKLYRESPEYRQVEAAVDDYAAAVEAYVAAKAAK